MKKILISLLAVICLLTVLTIPALADLSVTQDDTDFTKSYSTYFANNVLLGKYYIGQGTVPVNACTYTSVSNDQFGYSKVTLTALNGTVESEYTDGTIYGIDCDNDVPSGFAYVTGQTYAKKIVHYGYRATSSWDIVQFTATCT